MWCGVVGVGWCGGGGDGRVVVGGVESGGECANNVLILKYNFELLFRGSQEIGS